VESDVDFCNENRILQYKLNVQDLVEYDAKNIFCGCYLCNWDV